MKMRLAFACLSITCCPLFFVFPIAFSAYAHHPEKPITIKLQEAKLAPVIFPHTSHVEKNKIECAVCHHKDPKEPKACIKCHNEKEAKGKAPMTKDAFHNRCQPCHRENLEKGLKAPTKCNECHKK